MRRVWVVIATFVTASALQLGMTASASSPTRAKPRLKIDDPCSMLTRKQIGAKFGKPVVQGAPEVDFAGPYDCGYHVGNDFAVPPGGTFIAAQVYPSLFDSTGSSRDAVDDLRAVDGAGGNELSDVNKLGRSAFVNYTTGTLVVDVSKKFAFSLSWRPAPADTPISDKDAKKLVALAKDIVDRAPR